MPAKLKLLEIIQALNSSRLLLRASQGRQQHRGENRDDRDDHKQLNQCETLILYRAMLHGWRGRTASGPAWEVKFVPTGQPGAAQTGENLGATLPPEGPAAMGCQPQVAGVLILPRSI